MKPSDKIVRWQRHLARIKQDLQRIIIDHHVFKEVKNLIAANPVAKQGSWFHEWFDGVYAEATLIRVRRLMDKRKGTVSLLRLLEEIRDEPGCINFERHVALWEAQNADREFARDGARMDFDRYCGRGATCLAKRAVARDICMANRASQKLKEYAHERIAHYSEACPPFVPTYGDLERTLGCLQRIVLKYEVLLNGVEPDPLLPKCQYNWKAIFTVAWLPQSRAGLDKPG